MLCCAVMRCVGLGCCWRVLGLARLWTPCRRFAEAKKCIAACGGWQHARLPAAAGAGAAGWGRYACSERHAAVVVQVLSGGGPIDEFAILAMLLAGINAIPPLLFITYCFTKGRALHAAVWLGQVLNAALFISMCRNTNDSG